MHRQLTINPRLPGVRLLTLIDNIRLHPEQHLPFRSLFNLISNLPEDVIIDNEVLDLLVLFVFGEFLFSWGFLVGGYGSQDFEATGFCDVGAGGEGVRLQEVLPELAPYDGDGNVDCYWALGVGLHVVEVGC